MKSCLTQRIAADTKSGLYPALRGIAEDLERLNIKDRKPQLSYGMVNILSHDFPTFVSHHFFTFGCSSTILRGLPTTLTRSATLTS